MTVHNFELPRSPAASHKRGPSVTPGMGAKVADTKVAMLSSVSLWSSTLGAGTGVGEVSREDASGGGVVMSGTGGAEVALVSASREGTVTLTGGRVVLTVLGCGVRGFPGRRAGSVRTELGGGVVLVVNTVVVVGVVFTTVG